MSDDEITREVRLKVAFAKIARVGWTGKPYFVCPDCCTFTIHPDDVAHSYCTVCHVFKAESYMPLRCFTPWCPHFGEPEFNEETCTPDHAIPPGLRESEH